MAYTSERATCVRESALRVVDAATSGVSARVTAVIYQGGHFRVEAIADAAPNEPLHLDVREPASIRAGDRVQLAIDDGWVLPLADASLQSGKIRR